MSTGSSQLVRRTQLRSRKLRHGFKAAAKRRSLELRRAHGISLTSAIDCFDLAERLGIGIVRLSELPDSPHKHHLTHVAPEVMSAATIRRGNELAIWINDTHSTERQMSNLAHEMGHIDLEHQDAPVLNDAGCREHQAEIEAEADYFGSVLLVTDDSALSVVRAGLHMEEAAARYGVSRELMQWRINDSGAVKRVRRSRSSSARSARQ